MKRKGQTGLTNAILGLVIGVIVIGIVASLMSNVVQDVRDDQTADSAAANVSDDTLDGVQKITDNFSSVGNITGLALILGILGVALAFFSMRR